MKVRLLLNYFKRDGSAPAASYSQLLEAWGSHRLRQTLLLDADYLTMTQRSRKSGTALADFRELFTGLCSDLLAAVGSQTKLANLLLELCLAMSRYFAVKQLFWESGLAFDFVVECVAEYAKRLGEPTPSCNDAQVLLLALQALGCAFEETEVLASRSRCLNQHEGRVITKLIDALAIDFVAGEREEESLGFDDENNNDGELTSARLSILVEKACVLYHLFTSCSSGVIKLPRGEEFTQSGLVKRALAKDSKAFANFVLDCSRHCVGHFEFYGRRVNGLRLSRMSPETVVKLYEALHSIRCCLSVSEWLRRRIRDDQEAMAEIRLYLNRARVLDCIRSTLPLKDAFLVLVEDFKGELAVSEYE